MSVDPHELVSNFVSNAESVGLTVRSITCAFFEHNPCDWRVHAEIIPAYMPPFPRPDTKPIVVVKYDKSFLRHSCGPRQGFFWDLYGDDFMNVGLAFKALIEAPTPSSLWFVNAHCKANEEPSP